MLGLVISRSPCASNSLTDPATLWSIPLDSTFTLLRNPFFSSAQVSPTPGINFGRPKSSTLATIHKSALSTTHDPQWLVVVIAHATTIPQFSAPRCTVLDVNQPNGPSTHGRYHVHHRHMSERSTPSRTNVRQVLSPCIVSSCLDLTAPCNPPLQNGSQ